MPVSGGSSFLPIHQSLDYKTLAYLNDGNLYEFDLDAAEKWTLKPGYHRQGSWRQNILVRHVNYHKLID